MDNLKIRIKNDQCKKTESNNILRSKSHDRFLSKMFSIREMLKWKYNYFETNPREHEEFRQIQYKFNVFNKSENFKKFWRLRMDHLFKKESERALGALKKHEETRQQTTRESIAEMKNPTKLLKNYDSEVVNMLRRVREEYCFYLKHPSCYPDIDAEKKNFLTEKMDFKEMFLDYWTRRIPLLCDQEIEREKKIIRTNWKQLLPVYYSDKSIYSEELQELLLNSDED